MHALMGPQAINHTLERFDRAQAWVMDVTEQLGKRIVSRVKGRTPLPRPAPPPPVEHKYRREVI
jgi:hypothetical protein